MWGTDNKLCLFDFYSLTHNSYDSVIHIRQNVQNESFDGWISNVTTLHKMILYLLQSVFVLSSVWITETLDIILFTHTWGSISFSLCVLLERICNILLGLWKTAATQRRMENVSADLSLFFFIIVDYLSCLFCHAELSYGWFNGSWHVIYKNIERRLLCESGTKQIWINASKFIMCELQPGALTDCDTVYHICLSDLEDV